MIKVKLVVSRDRREWSVSLLVPERAQAAESKTDGLKPGRVKTKSQIHRHPLDP